MREAAGSKASIGDPTRPPTKVVDRSRTRPRRPTRKAPRLPYLGGLDTFRGVLMLMIFAYHAHHDWARGGFVSVEGFFVVSGFLITALLLREHRGNGEIDFAEFIARRARRLLPALWVTVVFAVLAALIFDIGTVSSVRREVLGTLFYANNWRQILADQSYFAAFADPPILRHTWTLAIEEHFYFLWPALLIGLLRWSDAKRDQIAKATGFLICLSTLWLLLNYAPTDDPNRFYMGSDTRFTGFLVGALGAVVLEGARLPTWAVRAINAAFWPGLAVFSLCALRMNEVAPFTYRGGLLLVDLAVLAMLPRLVSPSVDQNRPPGGFAFLGRIRDAVRHVGVISYGLYLFHWPIFLIVDEDSTALSGLPLTALRLALSLGAAELSYRHVERPIREARWTPRSTFAFAAAGTVALAALVVAMPSSSGTVADAATIEDHLTSDGFVVSDGQRHSADDPDAPLVVTAPSSTDASLPAPTDPLAPSTTTATEPSPLSPAPPTQLRIGLVGDSVASTLGAGFVDGVETGRITDAEYYDMALIGCGIVTGGDPISQGQVFWEPESWCDTWLERWQNLVVTNDPDITVVLIGGWELMDWEVDGVRYVGGTPEHTALLRGLLEEGLDVLTSGGGQVALVGFSCVDQGGSTLGNVPERTESARIAAFNDLLRQLDAEHDAVHFVDRALAECPTGVFDNELNGVTPLLYDGLHYSSEGSMAVWDWLLPQLRSIVAPTA